MAAFAAGLLLLIVSAPAVVAQKTYHPDHPAVEKMATAALKSMGNNIDPGMDALTALAVVEYYKRYRELVPADNDIVNKAVARVVSDVDAGKEGGILKYKSIYYPCLGLILLLEVDDEKYKPQIQKLLDMLAHRQMQNGSFSYVGSGHAAGVPDTSQTQYASLAVFVARQHGFNIDPEMPEKILRFYVDYQAPAGSWYYNPKPGGAGVDGFRLSLHSACISSVYMMADLLNLQPRMKSMQSSVVDVGSGLPPSVKVYIPPKEGEDASWGATGPVVDFEMGKLSSCKRSANNFYEASFAIEVKDWRYYYLYAFERYAWFREQAEGDLGRGKMTNWYDRGVDFLKSQQSKNGSFPGGIETTAPSSVSTALAVMFLVRSSEILSRPPNSSNLLGGEGFPTGVELKMKDGQIRSNAPQKSLADMMAALESDELSDDELKLITESMRQAVKDFRGRDDRSRGELKSFLFSMVGAENYFRRLIAVRILAAEQNLDNVPALLYAMGDPNNGIALEAHNGLRLISRKIDTFEYNGSADEEKNTLQLAALKKKWTEWFLKLRPDADLLD